MFPRKEFIFAHQLRGLTEESLLTLFEQWQERMKKDAKKKGSDEGPTPVRKQKVPVGLFENIIATLKPAFSVRDPESQDMSCIVSSVTEVMSPNDLHRFVRQRFTKRFGKNMNARATNLADKLVEMAFVNYNNYKGIVKVLTKGMIERAIKVSSNVGDVKSSIEEMINVAAVSDDYTWDIFRVRKCVDLLELASERLLAVLPLGSIRMVVERALVRVQQYKRKFVYVLHHLKELAHEARKNEAKAQAAAKLEAIGKGKKKKGKQMNSSNTEDEAEIELIVNDRLKILTVEESLELEFGLEGEIYVELEQNMRY
jgi:hypothetical protein